MHSIHTRIGRALSRSKPEWVPLQGFPRSPTWYPNKQLWTGSRGCPPRQVRLGEEASVRWKTERLGTEWEPSSVPTGWGQDGPQVAHSTHPTEGSSWGRCEQWAAPHHHHVSSLKSHWSHRRFKNSFAHTAVEKWGWDSEAGEKWPPVKGPGPRSCSRNTEPSESSRKYSFWQLCWGGGSNKNKILRASSRLAKINRSPQNNLALPHWLPASPSILYLSKIVGG